MQANPSKFQTISVGKETFDKKPVYKFGEAGMICEETVKLLDIDFKFNSTSILQESLAINVL